MSKKIRVIVISCCVEIGEISVDIYLTSCVLWRNAFFHRVGRLGEDLKDEFDRANALIP